MTSIATVRSKIYVDSKTGYAYYKPNLSMLVACGRRGEHLHHVFLKNDNTGLPKFVCEYGHVKQFPDNVQFIEVET